MKFIIGAICLAVFFFMYSCCVVSAQCDSHYEKK